MITIPAAAGWDKEPIAHSFLSHAHQYDGQMLEMAEIEAFLAVADELHFARAAERLVVSPSRVSQLVRQLEGRVGAELFARTTRRVELTAIGGQLATDLGKIYADLTDAMGTARAAAQGMEGVVRVGYLTHFEDPAFGALVSRFRAAFTSCDVAMIDMTGTDYMGALRAGDVDIALGRFYQDPPDDLVQGPVMACEEWLLGVAVAHPLAARESVSVEELAEYPIFGVPDALTGRLQNPLYPTETPAGRPIVRRGVARTLAEVLALAAQEENVFPTTAPLPRYYRHPGVVFIPLTGWPQGVRTLWWRPRGNNTLVTAFIRFTAELAPAASPGYGSWLGPRKLAE